MVNSFAFGDWDQICRNVPSMSVCNLFLKQQVTLLPPSDYPSALALPDRSTSPEAFNVAIAAAGVGVRYACAIPRMASVGGYPGSAGNVANIVACAIAVLVGLYFAFMAGKRQAAVARWEVRAFFIVFALQYLFQLLSTGSFIAQNSAALSWVTAIQLGFVLVLFWTLAWCAFLQLQVIEDGTLASIIPYLAMSTVLFVGFTYICLDTAFSVSSFFDTTPDRLHNNWLFVILIILSGAFVLFAIVVSAWVSGMFLGERRPLVLYSLSLLFFVLSQAAFWALSQIMCINTNSAIDGSFVSTLCIIISVVLFYFAWKTVTEDTWDEVQTGPMSEYGANGNGDLYSQGGRPYSAQSQSQYGASQYGAVPGGQHNQYAQHVSPIASNYPYADPHPR